MKTNLALDSDSTARSVHRIVYESFVGRIPDGMQINHIDGNKQNNHISNLEVCTPQENVAHAYMLGLARGGEGESNSMSKVKERQVLQMYDLFELGYSNKAVGEMFGLHDRYVSLIRHGKRWKYLFEKEEARETYSLGSLPYNLPRCVHIYNTVMLSKEPQAELAERLGIDSSTVSRIRTGKTWKSFRIQFGIPCSSDDWRDNRESLVVDILALT